MDLVAIGTRVRQARLRRDMKQAQLARDAGLSRTTISHLENGLISDLGIRKVEAVLALLDLTLAVEDAPTHHPPDYLEIAATTASVGSKRPLSSRALRRMLVTGRLPNEYETHVRRLLEEASPELMQRLVSQVARTHKPATIERNLRNVAARLRIPSVLVERWTKNA